MRLDVHRVNMANATISAFVDDKEFLQKLDSTAKKEAKQISLPGFRAGKVPINMIKQRYGKQLRQNTEQELTRDMYQQGLEHLGLKKEDILGDPIFDKYESANNSLEVVMKVSTKPIITITKKDYAPLVPMVDDTQVAVSDDEVQQDLEQLAMRFTEAVEVTDREMVQDRDFALIDFTGFIDDKAFEGGSAKEFLLELGSKQFIEGFEEQVIGMRKGEEKEISVTFPDNYGNKELAGRLAKFVVKLHTIKVKNLPALDDDLAKKIYSNDDNITIQKVKEEIKTRLVNRKKEDYYNDLKKGFFVQLIENFSDFALPDTIIDQEIDNLSRDRVSQMSDQEIAILKDDKDKIKALREELKPDAKDRVRITFIIDAMAKQEDVSVSDNELYTEIYMEALQTGTEPKKLIESYRESGLLAGMKMVMVENKVVHKLFDRALQGETGEIIINTDQKGES